MIKYEGITNIYHYNLEDAKKIIEEVESAPLDGLWTHECCYSRESTERQIAAVDKFLANIKVEQKKMILSRKETEEEARDYFGADFIKNFDNLLTDLDMKEKIVFIHGTFPEVCPIICEEGLRYRSPDLLSTSIMQHLNYGREETHYSEYRELLNWPHKDYKGLVIVAIPYECYLAKEGLWNHFQNVGDGYSDDYKINPDFIVGYIDVSDKELILNPKYSNEHDYTGLVKDNLFATSSKAKLSVDEFKEIVKSAPVKEATTVKKNNVSFISDEYENIKLINAFIDDEADYIFGLNDRFNRLAVKVKHFIEDEEDDNTLTEMEYEDFLSEANFACQSAKVVLPYMNSEKEDAIVDIL